MPLRPLLNDVDADELLDELTIVIMMMMIHYLKIRIHTKLEQSDLTNRAEQINSKFLSKQADELIESLSSDDDSGVNSKDVQQT